MQEEIGLLQELERIGAEAQAGLDQVADAEALATWRQTYLGKKGALTAALRSLGRLPAEERPIVGQRANQLRETLEASLEARQAQLDQQALTAQLAASAIDVRLPGRPQSLGAMHITSQTLRRIYEIFGGLGFQVFPSREVEDDVTNFQMLNLPPDHPARDMWSTFYLTDPGLLLRTHTSPGQIHAMRHYHPEPLRVILPGKCYRFEQVTSRHEFMFYQVEGLAIARNITMADLKGVLLSFARQMFGPERRLRFRPSYFPFTEPSAEADMDCALCGGKGCRVCKGTGWLEILGCGMVHPQVLRNGGYDPEIYSGFAFGMGPERIAMLKHGIDDIRLFYSADLRFLQQFA
ncbi:MAG: phenylalanine--tRNA ligase subunit alpha [Chloroflexi bacterium]|jgi:phenylalanyl-tRNA synthetase alpha chain|nr:phenylalanine--tRNA ligase subunit alpha [Chloroflexota bacterium]